MQPRSRVIHKAGAAIIKEGRLLLVRNEGTKAYLMPGGTIEAGETPEDALSRELDEELGLRTEPSTYRYIGSYQDIAANHPDAFVEIILFQVTLSDVPVMHSEIDSLLYWAPGDDVTSLSPIVKNQIIPDLQRKRLLDGGSP